MNVSRAEYCAIRSKIPLGIGDLSKMPRISDDIKRMLKTKEVVFLGKDGSLLLFITHWKFICTIDYWIQHQVHGAYIPLCNNFISCLSWHVKCLFKKFLKVIIDFICHQVFDFVQSKDEMCSAEQDILMEVVEIIKKHGGELGHPWRHTSYHSE